MADKWALFEALPEGLDVAQAVIYEETADAPAPRLGGRWAVWPDGQVWWEKPEGGWQRAIVTGKDLETTPQRWVRA